MMYAVLFDLDDTLYPERSYVESGFRAVAESLVSDRNAQVELLRLMHELFDSDPQGVFDRLIERLSNTHSGYGANRDISSLVHIYRSHVPQIHLYEDVIPALNELRRYNLRLGIITDGRADGQLAKIEALGLSRLMDVVIITDSLAPNRQYWKPHTRPFEVTLAKLAVNPGNAVYVGDNPTKDFHGPIRLGMRTVRVRRSDALDLFDNAPSAADHWLDAEHNVDDLMALLCLLEGWNWFK